MNRFICGLSKEVASRSGRRDFLSTVLGGFVRVGFGASVVLGGARVGFAKIQTPVNKCKWHATPERIGPDVNCDGKTRCSGFNANDPKDKRKKDSDAGGCGPFPRCAAADCTLEPGTQIPTCRAGFTPQGYWVCC